MELYQLRYFKAVAETEHFTRAAEILHISQPSLSKSISNLETELGVQLFERDKREVYLNDYGRAFLKRVNRILTEVSEAEQEIRDMQGNGRGDIYIGSCVEFSEPSEVYHYTRMVFRNYPHIALHMYNMDTAQIEEQLLERKLDFGFAVSKPIHIEIESTPLMTYRLGVVVSRDHPLAERGSVWLSELKDEPFMSNNTSPDLRDTVYELCRLAGFEPIIAFEGDSPELIGEGVAEGKGIAFISTDRHTWKKENKVDENDDRIVYLDVLDEFCVRTVYLFQLKDRYLTAAAREFRDGLIKKIKSEEDRRDL